MEPSSTLGAQLEVLCAQGRGEILLAAPFVKAASLKKLLRNVPPDVEVRLVTRWRPEEIIAGVSDLEVWPLLNARPAASLWLYPSLHAKYFRVDQSCLVGSANITARALGWAPQPNLELLVPLPAAHPPLPEFEARLLAGCSRVDEGIHSAMLAAVDALRLSAPLGVPQAPEAVAEAGESEDFAGEAPPSFSWLPRTRNASDLFRAYCEQDALLTLEARATTWEDLAFFAVPSGLGESAFNLYIAALLLQQGVVRKLDEFVRTPRRSEAIERLLLSLPLAGEPGFDAARTVQTLMRWLPHFLPTRYELRGADVLALL